MSNKNEDIYAQALEEFEGDNRNQGLYAKCFAEADGDENKAKARYIKSRADELNKSIVLKKTQEQSVGSREDKPEWLSHRLIPQICIGFTLGYLLISQINFEADVVSGTFIEPEDENRESVFKTDFRYEYTFKKGGTVHMTSMFGDGSSGTYEKNGNTLLISFEGEEVREFEYLGDRIIDRKSGESWLKNNAKTPARFYSKAHRQTTKTAYVVLCLNCLF